eukprot:2810170-Pyramimonas_sp.AAC.1
MTSTVDLDDDLNQSWDLSSEQRLSSSRVLGTGANSGAARSVTEHNKRLAIAVSVRTITKGPPCGDGGVGGAAAAGIADVKLAAPRLATVRGGVVSLQAPRLLSGCVPRLEGPPGAPG